MNIYQVKNAIAGTECIDYVYDGLYCSEPVMSKDKDGTIIDNYIVFARDDGCESISSPQCIFGIYSERGKTAYIDDAISSRYKEHLYQEHFENGEMMREARTEYMNLYPKVRDMYKTGADVSVEVVSGYVDALRVISGSTLFEFYKQLFPDFFEWTVSLK